MTDTAAEILARAICLVDALEQYNGNERAAAMYVKARWQKYLPEADAALAALTAAGLTIVPVEPTDERLEAGVTAWATRVDGSTLTAKSALAAPKVFRAIYKAMIAEAGR